MDKKVGPMPKTKEPRRPAKRRHPDTFRHVFLTLWAKDLDPDSVTKALGIVPDSTCIRGLLKDKDGKIVGKNGRARRVPVGLWILDARVHGNSTLETRIRSILEHVKPKKKALRRVLNKVNAELNIVVEPHRDVVCRSIRFPAGILNEFSSLGIDIEFCVDIPQKWDEFRRKVAIREETRTRRTKQHSRGRK